MKKLLIAAMLGIAGFAAQAQMEGIPRNPELNTAINDTDVRFVKQAITILREFRLQAYVQPEWQRADTAGTLSYSAGNFPVSANNRFLLRRGRFKFSFEHRNKKDLKIMDFAFQFDANEKGFTGVKDFYGRIIDPWTGWVSLQGGIFLRPFGFESTASPAFHESPEFARVNQITLPSETELGEALVIESPAKFEKFYIRLDANIVNGQGISAGIGAQTGTYQSKKDFIGRIKVGKAFSVGKARLGFNASASIYEGGVLQTDQYVYQVQDTTIGGKVVPFYKNIGISSEQFIKTYKREYYDVHLELKADYSIGTTTLRGEYMAGIQPGGAFSSGVALGSGSNPPVSDLYVRHFTGAMVYLTQSFKTKVKSHTMMHDFTVKYDYYDPQSQAGGMQLDPNLGFASTDVTFYTVGFGYSFIPYNWFKLMIWYDIVKNENTIQTPFSLAGPTGIGGKDNILTIRTQFYVDSWWFNAPSKYIDNLMLKKY